MTDVLKLTTPYTPKSGTQIRIIKTKISDITIGFDDDEEQK